MDFDTGEDEQIVIGEVEDSGEPFSILDDDVQCRDCESNEAFTTPKVKIKLNPTKEEMEDHNRTHLPFRDWCPHCIKGKAKTGYHFRQTRDDDDNQVPVISIDYAFLNDKEDKTKTIGDDEDEKGMPILVIKDRKSKTIRARVVPEKGAHSYAIYKLRQELE